MGVVYRARDALLDKLVAVKVMIHGADAAAQARFQREAQMASRLNHPGIVQVLDFGITDGDCPFMVMEYIDGRTLAEFIEERGRLSLPESLPVFGQIEALAHAHGQGVLGYPTVIDFGFVSSLPRADRSHWLVQILQRNHPIHWLERKSQTAP